MHYSVIYSVDIPDGVNMRPFVPPQCKKLWDETEDDSNYEFGYLEGRWEKGHHRKWCAILTEDQFKEFIDHVGLFPESCETMGSLGAPGYGWGWGWAPAISFRNDDPDAIQSAYVTPSGTRAELIAAFQQHEMPVPGALTDDPDQQYFWDECRPDPNQVWKGIKEMVLADYE